MSLLILIGLVLVLAGLAASGAASYLRRRPAPASGSFSALLPMLGAALSLLAVLDGGTSALPVPTGFAGGGIQMDQVSAVFLLLGFVVAGFVEAAVRLPTPRDRGRLRLCLSGFVLTMLSGDAFLLALGGTLTIAVLGGSAGGLGTGRVPMSSAAALLGACTLLLGAAAPSALPLADASFARLRGGGQPVLAGSVLFPLLAIAAATPLLGIWPCQNWHRRLHAVAPPWAPALSTLLGVFLLLRLLLDLPGTALPAGPGAVLVLIGAAGGLRAGIAAMGCNRLGPAVGWLATVPTAFMAAAVGCCLLARAVDLPALAGAALDATLLLLPTQVLVGVGALVLARAMEAEAGAGTLKRLGGLSQSMPRASLLAGACAAMLGCLFPAGAFIGLWLLLQDALAMARLGGWLALLMPVAVLALAMSAALCLAGWLRLASVTVLGRPRTPRGAAALDVAPTLVRALCALLAAPLLVGLLPGAWLRLLAPLRSALAAAGDLPAFRLLSPGGTASLSPAPLLLLGLLGVWLPGRVRRLLPERPVRYAPPWEGGAPPPPPWLPFGDPLTQVGAAALPQALLLALDGMTWQERASEARRWVRRQLRHAIASSRRAGTTTTGLLRQHSGVLSVALLAAVLAWSVRHPMS